MSDPSGLVARTFALPADHARSLDLLAFAGDDGLLFVREGVGLAARGSALRIELPHGTSDTGHVRSVLRAIRSDDALHRSGSGPVAMGALAFDRNAPGHLVVPEVLVAKSSDGTAWCTTVAPMDGPPPPLPPLVSERRPRWSPHGFDLHSSFSHEDWCDAVAAAVQRIRDGALHKVVLARAVDVVATNDLVVSDILGRLQMLFPSCMVFSMEGFVGASPELLVSRKGSQVKAHPLAGTVARSGDPETDAKLAAGLLASPKDRWEHSLVIDAIADVLRPLCDELDVPGTPSIVPLRNVSHLGTVISGSLHAAGVADGSARTALEFVGALHPTPAVGGAPTDTALALIGELERDDRGTYAGPVGWVDAAGNGEWAVGLRSARIDGNRARMFAGVGIVNDSEPLAELTETQLKLQALLSAVVRP